MQRLRALGITNNVPGDHNSKHILLVCKKKCKRVVNKVSGGFVASNGWLVKTGKNQETHAIGYGQSMGAHSRLLDDMEQNFQLPENSDYLTRWAGEATILGFCAMEGPEHGFVSGSAVACMAVPILNTCACLAFVVLVSSCHHLALLSMKLIFALLVVALLCSASIKAAEWNGDRYGSTDYPGRTPTEYPARPSTHFDGNRSNNAGSYGGSSGTGKGIRY